ncbi:NAD(P)-binding domain-containing protein [Kribbella sp. DT2]|uniref:NAD(P)-binding domain-containing protein n=1 Tax=Kribbella sp. DT2 TaxID=3393427 RepID=UPI003CF82325
MYGFVGTGELTAAIVTGLAGPAGPTGDSSPLGASGGAGIFLSPRGKEIGQELAERFPDVRVCSNNQEVIDSTPVVVLAVRPQVAQEVLQELTFHDQVVVSAIAAVSLAQLREWAPGAAAYVRSIPLPAAANRQSLTAMYPDDPTARELFERVGQVVVPADEQTLDAFSAATATAAAHLDYVATIADWLSTNGVAATDATAYMAHLFAQLGQSLDQPNVSLTELAAAHMTPGGLNQQFKTDLHQAGVPNAVRAGLDRVLARVRGTAHENQPPAPDPVRP